METAKTEITEYNATRAGLADITKRMENVIYDVTTTSGMEGAKLDRRELITLRTTLESKRKILKAPALERSRLIDAEAKLVDAAIRKLEDPIDKQIKAEEQKAKDEKEKKLNATREKTRLIMERIEKLKALPERYALQTAEKVKEVIEQVKASPPDSDGFGDYLVLATEAYNETMVALIRLHEVKVETEAVAAKAEEDRLAEIEDGRIEREKAQKILDDAQKKLDDDRKEFEDSQAEIRRIAGIKEQINLHFGPNLRDGISVMNSEKLTYLITLLEAEECPDDVFFEFTSDADEQRLNLVSAYKVALEIAIERETEELRIETDRLVKVDEDRIAAEAETKRLSDLAIENEKKRKKAEADKKISDRKARIAEAKCTSATEAFQKIIELIDAKTPTPEDKLDEIQVIAEANI